MSPFIYFACFLRRRSIKPNGNTRMDNPQTHAIQHTEQRQQNKQKYNTEIKNNKQQGHFPLNRWVNPDAFE